MTQDTAPILDTAQQQAFERNGYLILRQRTPAQRVAVMRQISLTHLSRRIQPIEYEADVAYPGAPADRGSAGGDTARRLLQAYDRDPAFANWARDRSLTALVAQLLETSAPRLTRAHHNCVMTKHPAYSSATGWHQDLRYWSFEKPLLINAWLALGEENRHNGCMRLIPGSHHLNIDAQRLDADRFLRADLPENRRLIDSAEAAELAPGDVLLFHAGTFHAAGRNQTDRLKLSVVFTYHAADNRPLAGTRSDRQDSIALPNPART